MLMAIEFRAADFGDMFRVGVKEREKERDSAVRDM